MNSTETTLQAADREKETDRKREAELLGERFYETNRIFSEYYRCIMEKCDPVEQAVILHLREVIEDYEKSIAEIQISGFSIYECMNAYMERGGTDE